MASGVFVNESGRILVSLFFWIGKRVTTLLPIFFLPQVGSILTNYGFGAGRHPPRGALYSGVWQAIYFGKRMTVLYRGSIQ